MIYRSKSPGYTNNVEASHVTVTAAPGAVFLRLRRDLVGEAAAGKPPVHMFVELSISEAYQHWVNVGDALHGAGALATAQRSGVDSAAPL